MQHDHAAFGFGGLVVLLLLILLLVAYAQRFDAGVWGNSKLQLPCIMRMPLM